MLNMLCRKETDDKEEEEELVEDEEDEDQDLIDSFNKGEWQHGASVL